MQGPPATASLRHSVLWRVVSVIHVNAMQSEPYRYLHFGYVEWCHVIAASRA